MAKTHRKHILFLICFDFFGFGKYFEKKKIRIWQTTTPISFTTLSPSNTYHLLPLFSQTLINIIFNPFSTISIIIIISFFPLEKPLMPTSNTCCYSLIISPPNLKNHGLPYPNNLTSFTITTTLSSPSRTTPNQSTSNQHSINLWSIHLNGWISHH